MAKDPLQFSPETSTIEHKLATELETLLTELQVIAVSPNTPDMTGANILRVIRPAKKLLEEIYN